MIARFLALFLALFVTAHAPDARAVPQGATPPVTQAETIWAKLRRGYLAKRYANPHVNKSSLGPQVMASPPTVTVVTTQPSGLTKYFSWGSGTASPASFLVTGGDAYTWAGGLRVPVTTLTNGGSNGNVSNGRNAVGWRVKTFVDSTKFAVQVVQGGNYRLVVDGQYVASTVWTPTNGGFSNWIVADFTSAGGRARREVWIEGDQSATFYALWVSPTESVEPAPSGLRMTVFGDSITGATSSGVTVPSLNDGFAYVLGDCFGITDVRASGSGGEGILQPANTPTTGAYTLRQRLPYDAVQSDVFVIAMGSNDASFGASALTAEMLLDIQWLRTNYPAAPVIVFGAPGNQSGPSATTIAIENAYAAAVTAANDPMVIFVPVSTAPTPMLFGTGKYGATNSSGNSDLYVGSDGTHPTAAGHPYWGAWLADHVYAAIQSKP